MSVNCSHCLESFTIGVYTRIMKGEANDHILKCADIASRCTCKQLRQADRLTTNMFDAALAPSGLTVSQFGLLIALTLMREPTISNLSDKLAMDRTTLTRSLKPLLDAKLVIVEPGDDRRTKLARITSKGTAALTRAMPLWDEAQETIVSRLGKHNWKDLMDGLNAAIAVTSLP